MVGRSLVCVIALAGSPIVPSPTQDVPKGQLSKDAINQVILSHVRGIKFCYEKQLQKSPNIAGMVEVAWNVEQDGHVSGARVAKSTMNNQIVEDCIVRQVSSWKFAAASERTVVARYPFVFKGEPLAATPPGRATDVPPAAPPSDSPIVRTWVSRAGVIELNGKQVDLATLSAALADLAKHKGVVVYGREDPAQAPHANGVKVMQLVIQNRLPIRMTTKRDFTGAIGPDGKQNN